MEFLSSTSYNVFVRVQSGLKRKLSADYHYTVINTTGPLAFTKVVMIEYPKDGLWTLAMVTGESTDTKGNEYYNLFVPTTPNPTSGYLIMIQKNKTIDANITVDEGLSIVVSAGMIGPTKLNL